MKTKPIPAITARMFAQLIEARVTVTPNGCWEFTSHLNASKRPVVHIDGETYYAYRVAYTFVHGPIPEGQMVRHACDNPSCASPAHLLAGSALDNTRDMYERGRESLPPVHLGAAHPLTRVTPEMAEAIAVRYAAGEATQEQLAQEYGLTQATVGRIVRGETGFATSIVVRRGKGRGPQVRPHGTRAAYERHRRAGERPCEPCAEANREHCRRYKQRLVLADALHAVEEAS